MGTPNSRYWFAWILAGSLLALGMLLASCATPTVEPTKPAKPPVHRSPPPCSNNHPIRNAHPAQRIPDCAPDASRGYPGAIGWSALPVEARVLALIGSDSISPFPGRSDALVLVIYHPRLDAPVCFPSRPICSATSPATPCSASHSLGGWRLPHAGGYARVQSWPPPDDYALVHLDDFVYFIDDLGGLEVTIAEELPEYAATSRREPACSTATR